MPLMIEFDAEARAVYIRLRHPDEGVLVHHSVELDDSRRIEVDAGGEAIGIEVLNVDDGVNLDGLPRAEEIREALRTLREIPQHA